MQHDKPLWAANALVQAPKKFRRNSGKNCPACEYPMESDYWDGFLVLGCGNHTCPVVWIRDKHYPLLEKVERPADKWFAGFENRTRAMEIAKKMPLKNEES